MCTRTVGTLAHVFEAAGLATVALASQRGVMEALKPPRALYGDFPLGRPLGKPRDAEFQHDVLAHAFAMLLAADGPVLADYPEAIETETEALACQMPPRFDAGLHPAIDEINGIRGAWDRSRVARGTSVGRVLSADTLAAAITCMQAIVDGTSWRESGVPGNDTTAMCHDLRTYYEEAAVELTTGPTPGGRAAENWYFTKTEAGKLTLAARRALQAQEAPFGIWYYMAPSHRH